MTRGLLGLSPDLVKIFSAQHDIASINLDFPTPDKDKPILKGERQKSCQIEIPAPPWINIKSCFAERCNFA